MPKQIAAEDARERRRRSDGEQTRGAILDAAARLSSVEGIEGLSIGRLARAIGMSKSGLYAHFGSKVGLQLATIDAARSIMIDEVVTPALSGAQGIARLERLCEAFLSYVERRVFPGGCFLAAAAAEMDARPGPVRDRVAAYRREWTGLIEGLVRQARRTGEARAEVDPAQVAFELDAALVAANTAFVLHGDPAALDRARTVVRRALEGARS